MSIVKRAVVLVAAVCMLVGSPAMKVSAACDHSNNHFRTQWTGQYKFSYPEHTVVVGHYTNGDPITVVCNVSKVEKICLLYCDDCGAYLTVVNLPYQENHSVVHN
ncbi:MAG: hypothetical protein HDQ99_18700 [Lachnospiraceae bacterium]|nr:hypothetical protein [Lachnospiraceae bacterium]